MSTHRPSRPRILLALGLLASLASCGDPTGPTSFTITATPTTLSVRRGASGTITVNVTQVGTAAPVTITMPSLPPGVTVSALTIAANQTSGTLTVSASATANLGSASVQIRGVAGGETRFLDYVVTITP